MSKLVGLLFLLIAAAMAVWLISDLYRWLQAQSWQPVSAELLHVELRENRSDDSTTWQVQARYQYDFGGQQWQSERVAISTGSDNIGDFHRRLHSQLSQSWQQQQPVTAWVNPDDPQQALLNRELRAGLVALKGIFPLVFGGIGLTALLFGRGRKRPTEAAGKDELQDALWRQRQQWQSNTLQGAGSKNWIAAMVMALLWNAISLPLLFVLPEEIRAGNHAALLGLLFPLVGIGLMVWAVRSWQRWRRYGQSQLHLDAMPVALGGVLRATLEIPARLSSRSLQVQLLCVRKTVRGTGKNRRSSESILWENQYDVSLQASGSAGAHNARIVIPLPGDQPVSSWQNRRDQIIWRLSAKADEPGVDYASEFELPVLAVDTEPSSEEHLAELPAEKPDLWRDTGVQQGYTSHGQRFYWPRLRLLTAGLSTLLAALLFGGIGLFLLLREQAWLLGGIFTLVALPILWGAITMLFQRSEIIIGQGQLRYQHGVFAGEKVIPLAEIRALSHQRSGSIGKRTFYRLEVQRWGSERNISIAGWLPGERQTAALVKHLQQLL